MPICLSSVCPPCRLLFFAVAAGTGSGLTIINNLAQIGKALDTKSISSFVSLVSIWNCAGRLLAGCVHFKRFPIYSIPFIG